MEKYTAQTSKYAQILVDVKNIGSKTFSYMISDALKNTLKLGQVVKVPFGRQGTVNGYVVGFSNYLPSNIQAKSSGRRPFGRA